MIPCQEQLKIEILDRGMNFRFENMDYAGDERPQA